MKKKKKEKKMFQTLTQEVIWNVNYLTRSEDEVLKTVSVRVAMEKYIGAVHKYLFLNLD
jgi:hypothetical protein